MSGPTPSAPEAPGTLARLTDLRSLDGALLRYRILAYTIGVGLALLVFVGIPLQYAAGLNQVDAIVGPIHGFFYIAYLVFALDLARRARFSPLEMLAMVGAGLLPVLAFVIEHRITRRVRTEVLPTWTVPRRHRRSTETPPADLET
jgi:integral membrane protein